MSNAARNCFISYHHENDQEYFARLRQAFEDMHLADHSLHNDISHLEEEAIYRRVRELMRSCSITIVLVGERTGHRKWIDWEIWASLRAYTHPDETVRSFRPSGLVAVFLPGQRHAIPPRLHDNILSGYAACLRWENIDRDFEAAVRHAYSLRMNHSHRIDNSRKRQRANYRADRTLFN